MFVKRRLRKLNLSADGCELMGAVQDPPVECSAGAIALGLDSGEVLLLCSETGSRRLSVSTERRGPVISVRLSEHGDAVAAVSRHGWQVLEVPSGHTQASVQLDAGRRVQLAVISPCLEKVAVSLGASTELGLYRFFSGEEESLPFRLSSRLACAAFGIDASQLASGDVEGGFRVWDASTGREVISVDSAHHGEILSLAFSSNGERIVSGGSDNSCKLWDACSGQPLQTFLGHTSKVTSVAFSPDGLHIASAGLDRSMYVWRADSATRLHILQGHDGRGGCRCAYWSPSPERCAVVGHTDSVHAALFAPAGAAVASASRDGSCKIWCAASGALLRTIGAGRWVVCADFGRDVVLDGRARRRREAVVMCMHPRLGHDSLLAGLEPGVLRMVIEGT